jgi:hypothetical protein
MKRSVLNKTPPLLGILAVSLFALGCVMEEDLGTPIFPETDLMTASYSEGQFYFSPSWDVEYIVLGIFDNPIVTVEKSIVNMIDMEGGSSTGLSGFTRGQVAETSLYIYSDVSRSFSGAPGGYDPSGKKYWSVWGFNSDWVIISSSKQTTTDFP